MPSRFYKYDFSCLTSDINFLIFNCLRLDIILFIFSCLTSSFCFLKIISSTRKRERLFMDVPPLLHILNIQENDDLSSSRRNKYLKYSTLCRRSILNCGFPTKGITITQSVLSEVLGVPQPWGTSVLTILVGHSRKFVG